MQVKNFNRQVMIVAALVAVLVIGATIPLAGQDQGENSDVVTLCHATGNETNPYAIIEISVNAAFKDEGGHFFEDGTPQAGHESDFVISSEPIADYPNVPIGLAEDCQTGEMPSETPVAGEETPVVGEETPVVGEETPVVAEETPVVAEVTPVVAEVTPAVSQMPDKVTLCHATGSETNPYEEITVSYNAAIDGHGHEDHMDDIIPVPATGCPTGEMPDRVTLCHATGIETNPYDEITVLYNAAVEGHGHEDHMDDILPAPIAGCPDVSLPPNFPPVALDAPTCPDWLVYHTNITGDWEIFRLGDLPNNLDADPNLTQGVGLDVDDLAPSRSPDGRWIAFVSNRDGNWEIYIASTDGTNQYRVTNNTRARDFDPVWSPTGQFIVFESTRDGNWELYMNNINSAVEYRLTNDPASDINAFWSPNGTHVLFQSDRNGEFWQIYELDITTLNLRLVSDGQGNDRAPVYSFDGTQLLFLSDRDGNANVIYTMNLDGSGVTRISDPAGNALNAVWSPDDTMIAYQSNLDGDLDIYAYEVASEKTRLVTDNHVGDYAPTWLCDGTTIVFTSEVQGDPNLFNTAALPIEAAAIVVEDEAEQMTFDKSVDRYPLGSPVEEEASQRGMLPMVP